MRSGLLLVGAVAWTSACAWPPSAECQAYVECRTAIDPDADVEGYEAGEACWRNASTSVRCTEMCRAALEALGKLPNAPPACAPR